MIEASRLRPGLLVETIDRQSLGVVADISEDRILVRPAFRQAFWISEVFVRCQEPGRIVLHLDRRQLRRYRPDQRNARLLASRWTRAGYACVLTLAAAALSVL